MEAIILTGLEKTRLACLRLTLRSHFLRDIFRDRPRRLFAQFLFALLLYFPLAVYFPLWILALGPILMGVPHLISGIRYQNYLLTAGKSAPGTFRPLIIGLGSIWTIVAIVRLSSDFFGLPIKIEFFRSDLFEGAAGALTIIALAFIYKQKAHTAVAGLLCYAPVLLLLWRAPMLTVGALMLAHNAIAFLYWIAACEGRRDKRAAISAALIFLGIHVLVLSGAVDFLFAANLRAESLSWAGTSIESFGEYIVPWSHHSALFDRCVTLLALGQPLHYFIWMKAVPEQYTPHPVPTTFRKSWNFLKRDLSPALAISACALAAVPAVIWLLINFSWTYKFYFAVASFHSYLELSALSLIFVQRARLWNRPA